ncbi:GINS complex subunit 4 [Fistulifera solaris]|uniref:GINS complex subunit 4 n=1 Tax=Fistulifera solaris TaxID=1519565 RepID=A0A1Z5JVS0_FISSO|nr:GINS complex subunit 4 [Fistulifera solaris]|eukprot:GAX18135.1 GINS complex subunit 4 [Fistulifera solaris]
MADLYNLLDELDHDEQKEEIIQDEQEWEAPVETAVLPADLLDAQKRQLADNDRNEDAEKVLEEDTPYSRLRNVWSQELNSPELLPFDEDIFQAITELIEEWEEAVDQCEDDPVSALMASITSVQIERAKHVLCDWLATRLRKIEEYPFYIRDNKADCLSQTELSHIQAYCNLVEKHLNRTVLDHFPQEAWKELPVETPSFDYTYVFVKCLAPTTIDKDQLERGDSLIVHYSKVRDSLRDGNLKILAS